MGEPKVWRSLAYRKECSRAALAKPTAIYMHCMPADRDIEVTSEVMDGPQSVLYDQAENRMHTVKALMALTMGNVQSRR